MKTVSIVGFGRFGKTLYKLIKDDFNIIIYDHKKVELSNLGNIKIAKHIADVYKAEVIFYAVPIAAFEEVIVSHKKYFQKHHLLEGFYLLYSQ